MFAALKNTKFSLMNFKTLFLIGLAALAFGACGDDDDEPMASRADLLAANNWVYDDFYDADGAFGLKSCNGDDFLAFSPAATSSGSGQVVFDNADDADTCTISFVEYAGTYMLTNDSLIITATDSDGEDAGGRFGISRLDATELRLTEEDDDLGAVELRYTAQ